MEKRLVIKTPMAIVRGVGDLITVPPEPKSWRWWLSRLFGHGNKAAQFALVAAILAGQLEAVAALASFSPTAQFAVSVTGFSCSEACGTLACSPASRYWESTS